MQTDHRRHRRRGTWTRGAWILRGLAALVLVGLGSLLALLLASPSVGDAQGITRSLAEQRGIAYPGPVPPQRFIEALVATEDQRFFSPLDPGVDAIAILRVVVGRAAGFPDQGGSTILQQLAKMLYSPRRHGLGVELERVALALKLNFTYSKPALLTMYAEVAYYGHGYYGLEAASCGYFGKPPSELSWSQAAMLAGAVNAPSLDDPITHPAAARAREEHVFDRLVAVGVLTRAQADASLSGPLGLGPSPAGSGACR